MFLIFLISLSILFYLIVMELNKPLPSATPLTGACPGCTKTVVSGWLVCPQCQTVLRDRCSACGKVHDSWVSYCPWCRHEKGLVTGADPCD
jgi:hypothetical protein